ncbi:hypothetical protein, partial [Bartonella henselae]|uniref:hypothetical protein n=1 Tax=Bartonella henselae TaxID=38323 RepID=UPI001AEC9D08
DNTKKINPCRSKERYFYKKRSIKAENDNALEQKPVELPRDPSKRYFFHLVQLGATLVRNILPLGVFLKT